MKLYHRISRFAFRRNVSKSTEKRIRWILNMKKGDMINDCTGFNRYIVGLDPDRHYSRNGVGWYMYDVDIEVSNDPTL